MSRAYCTLVCGGGEGEGEGDCRPCSKPAAARTAGSEASSRGCRLMAGVGLGREGPGGKRKLYHGARRRARGFADTRLGTPGGLANAFPGTIVAQPLPWRIPCVAIALSWW